MRGIETPVREIRKKVFTEIAKFAYEQRDLEEIEDLPCQKYEKTKLRSVEEFMEEE